ncbi:ABC transporter ATP-binding protein [Microvirga pudoricolor]|uniref:ABC transporter ATP-binding protein n=1 Tax=Microvirga pudoricolor TaxID=2778729 RepID=UPI00194FC639|nr:ABC transporter ATP-binding protein [Microvirga pudoricolor]MBM6593844.1 ABC transporter ATP-binding protein [Microvirga pudoricolor]
MERDPLRLAWTTAPGRHAAALILLVVVGGLLLWEIDLVRAVVDGVVPGAATVPFGRIALPMPQRLGFEPVVLYPGIPLEAAFFERIAIVSLGLIPFVMGSLLVAVDWIAVGIGGRVLQRVRTTILDAILRSSPSAREEAVAASALAGDALARESDILGFACVTSVRVGGMVALGVIYTLVTDWHLGIALAAVLGVGAMLFSRRLLGRVRAGHARRTEGERTGQILQDLLNRMPALRAHGTGPYERGRIGEKIVKVHGPVQGLERRAAATDIFAPIVLMLAPVAVLGLGLWDVAERQITPGSLAACTLAAALSAGGTRELVQWHRMAERVRGLLVDIARGIASLQTRDRRTAPVPLPASGALLARGVSAYDPSSGGRIANIDLNIPFPAHVALVGDGDSGARLFAALAGGHLDASTGNLTYGGVDLSAVDPATRAHRIAFAGDTILIPGTLRDNFLYGAPADGDVEARLAQAVQAAGLDRLVHARGMEGTFNPAREPRLAASILEARGAVQAALLAEGIAGFVDPFNASRYNSHASIGRNILFGKPIGDTFSEEHLASHPFVRAVLEAGDLTKPLVRMGFSIATSMIEIFADVPDGHPLFERFAFFSAADRPYFEDLVARRNEKRRGVESARDRERLMGLALRYSESRHRLGLLDEALQARILTARADFAKMLPPSLQAAIEFYHEDRFCTAASVLDNLLFGRIASEQAGAEAAVQAVIRRVLAERGLDGDLSRIGYDTPVDVRGGDLTLSEIAAIDLVRCLVRRPDMLIVERALDGLPGPAADRMVAALRRAMAGRGLMIVTPAVSAAMDDPPFDAVIRFARGVPTLEARALRKEEALV